MIRNNYYKHLWYNEVFQLILRLADQYLERLFSRKVK